MPERSMPGGEAVHRHIAPAIPFLRSGRGARLATSDVEITDPTIVAVALGPETIMGTGHEPTWRQTGTLLSEALATGRGPERRTNLELASVVERPNESGAFGLAPVRYSIGFPLDDYLESLFDRVAIAVAQTFARPDDLVSFEISLTELALTFRPPDGASFAEHRRIMAGPGTIVAPADVAAGRRTVQVGYSEEISATGSGADGLSHFAPPAPLVVDFVVDLAGVDQTLEHVGLRPPTLSASIVVAADVAPDGDRGRRGRCRLSLQATPPVTPAAQIDPQPVAALQLAPRNDGRPKVAPIALDQARRQRRAPSSRTRRTNDAPTSDWQRFRSGSDTYAPMNVVVLYESMTGNTERAAELIADAVHADGNSVVLRPADSFDHHELSEADLVFIGTWVDGLILFGHRPGGTKNLAKLPGLWDKPVATFVTYAVNPGKAADKFGDYIGKFGASVVARRALHRKHLEDEVADYVLDVLAAMKVS